MAASRIPAQASADLRLAVIQWVEQGLAYTGKGEAPRDAIAGGVGLGKTTVTLEVLAQMAQGKTVHYYAPTLELGEEVVAKARALGLDAVLVRGREANKKNPDRWPALCLKEDVAATLGRVGRNVWESLCRKEDDFGNVTKCEYFDGCPYVRQFDDLEGKLVVLAHEYLTLPKTLIAKPALVVVDERFHTTLSRPVSLPLERVTASGLPRSARWRPIVAELDRRRRHGHPRGRGRQDHGRGRAHARTAAPDGPDTRRGWPNRRPSGPTCPMPSSGAAPSGCRRSRRSGWPSCGACLPRTMSG